MFNSHSAPPLDVPSQDHWARLEADRAFTAAAWARRRAALLGARRPGRCHRGLSVYDTPMTRRRWPCGVCDIPLEAIAGTTEPNRAAQFDADFLPRPQARGRWQAVWLATQRGVALPPISVVRIGDAYAIRDGHHRVSVAKARGARTIPALVT
jgi:ParB-like nuclease domain